jgi:hypothetical protein
MHYQLCLLAFIFIGASLYTMFTCETCQPFTSYKHSLKPKQLELYQMVARQRLNLAIGGLVLGAALALLYLYLFHNTLNPFVHGCAFAGITLLVQYLYYVLSPKMSMLPHLDDQRQVDNWYKVYKFMQYRYHAGMALGAVGYFLLAYAGLVKC